MGIKSLRHRRHAQVVSKADRRVRFVMETVKQIGDRNHELGSQIGGFTGWKSARSSPP